MYDDLFKKYTNLYFNMDGVDWRLFLAQATAESSLNPRAVSYVGAQGLMQIMPATFADIKKQNKAIKGDILDPETNIAAGIFYDRQQWNAWHDPKRTLEDRLKYMFASYNAGRGNIIKAQNLCPDKLTWKGLAPHLQMVTGKHAKETIGYVDRIFRIYGKLLFALSEQQHASNTTQTTDAY